MLFAIDIGNTNVHIGFFSDSRLVHTFCLGTDKNRTSDEYALLLKSISEISGYKMSDFDGVMIGSVVPSATNVIENAVASILDVPVMVVGPGIKTGFSIKTDTPSELGADLVANAAGAIAKTGGSDIVADFGTASTISVIDENKSYIGVSVMPGIQMSLDALQNTGLLPGLSANKSVPFIGKNTKDCIYAGVLRGQALAAQGFINMYKEAFFKNKNVNIIVSGGFSQIILPYLPPESKHIPNLTLYGLCEIYKHNKVISRKK